MHNSDKIEFLNVCVTVDKTVVLDNCSIKLAQGSIHVIMGPNGSGKSSFAHTLIGHEAYQVTQGSIFFDASDRTFMSAQQRSLELGVFMAYQNVVAIPGLQVIRYLHELLCLHHKIRYNLDQALYLIRPCLIAVDLPESVLYRSLYDGFSGGEKKRLEIVQLLLIKPQIVVLDEIDSGLDIDGMIKIAQALNDYKNQNPQVTFVIITHYAALLEYITPDYVHLMINKKIVRSGNLDLLRSVMQSGFESYV